MNVAKVAELAEAIGSEGLFGFALGIITQAVDVDLPAVKAALAEFPAEEAELVRRSADALLEALPLPSALECDRGGCHRPATARGTQGFRWCDEHLPPTNAEIVEATLKAQPQELPRCPAVDPDEGMCLWTPHDERTKHWFSMFALPPVEPPAPLSGHVLTLRTVPEGEMSASCSCGTWTEYDPESAAAAAARWQRHVDHLDPL